jgi:hypothetical protein
MRIKNPFNMEGVTKQEEFNGIEFPTYFNLVGNYTNDNPKNCQLNHKLRVQYETNAENNYFNRDKDSGEFSLKLNNRIIDDYSLNLWNGLATLTIAIPKYEKIGDIVFFDAQVFDISRVEPFTNRFYVKIIEEQIKKGSSGKRKKPASDKNGNDRQKESHLNIPNIVDIRKEDWNKDDYKDFKFNELSALKVKNAGEKGGYDFFINMDNSYLKTEIKGDIKTPPAILEARFRYGMVLLGISILDFKENKKKKKSDDDELVNDDLSVYEQISLFTEAISPTLLPMISSLSSSEFGI